MQTFDSIITVAQDRQTEARHRADVYRLYGSRIRGSLGARGGMVAAAMLASALTPD